MDEVARRRRLGRTGGRALSYPCAMPCPGAGSQMRRQALGFVRHGADQPFPVVLADPLIPPHCTVRLPAQGKQAAAVPIVRDGDARRAGEMFGANLAPAPNATVPRRHLLAGKTENFSLFAANPPASACLAAIGRAGRAPAQR